jgi:dihydroorotase
MISESHVGELEDLRWAEVDKAITVARQNRDVVPGIKVRLGKLQSGNNTVESLKRAIEAAEAIDGFVMSHIGACPVPIEELAAMMRPGDVVTHAFHGIGDRIANLDGVLSGILEARERGVLFDVGHGMGGFSFDTAERALAAGFVPDNISTDLHIFNVEGPVYDLVTTLTKFMHLGMSLDDVIERSTISAARIMGLKGGYGTLAVGAIGDAAILRLDEGRFTLNDRLSKALNIGGMTWQKPISVDASTKLSHVRTIIRGQIYRPWQGQRP